MCHAAGAGGSSTDGLLGPVVSAELGTVAETGILSLLLVPVRLATSSAQGVCLVVTFALCLSTCTLHSIELKPPRPLTIFLLCKDNNNTHSLLIQMNNQSTRIFISNIYSQ